MAHPEKRLSDLYPLRQALDGKFDVELSRIGIFNLKTDLATDGELLEKSCGEIAIAHAYLELQGQNSRNGTHVQPFAKPEFAQRVTELERGLLHHIGMQTDPECSPPHEWGLDYPKAAAVSIAVEIVNDRRPPVGAANG